MKRVRYFIFFLVLVASTWSDGGEGAQRRAAYPVGENAVARTPAILPAPSIGPEMLALQAPDLMHETSLTWNHYVQFREAIANGLEVADEINFAATAFVSRAADAFERFGRMDQNPANAEKKRRYQAFLLNNAPKEEAATSPNKPTERSVYFPRGVDISH